MSEDKIEFEATVPGTQTAIQIHGSGGMRIVLDIPDLEVGNAIGLLRMTKFNLKVTIEALPYESFGHGRPPADHSEP